MPVQFLVALGPRASLGVCGPGDLNQIAFSDSPIEPPAPVDWESSVWSLGHLRNTHFPQIKGSGKTIFKACHSVSYSRQVDLRIWLCPELVQLFGFWFPVEWSTSWPCSPAVAWWSSPFLLICASSRNAPICDIYLTFSRAVFAYLWAVSSELMFLQWSLLWCLRGFSWNNIEPPVDLRAIPYRSGFTR